MFQENSSSEEAEESQLLPTAAIVEHGDEEAVAEILDREAEQADSEAEQPMEDS
jgi:predicted metal-dependent TIM-barrel fold hydrolase